MRSEAQITRFGQFGDGAPVASGGDPFGGIPPGAAPGAEQHRIAIPIPRIQLLARPHTRERAPLARLRGSGALGRHLFDLAANPFGYQSVLCEQQFWLRVWVDLLY
jgi:hypothetical protein